MMPFQDCFPIWNALAEAEKEALIASAVPRTVKKGTALSGGVHDCVGLYLVCSGQLRAYIVSDEGKEVTIYRLLKHDMCLFSASCILNSIQFDIAIEAEKDSEMWVIPPDVYKGLMARSIAVSNYTNELMSARFTEVMWLIEQIMWKRFDQRLAAFLREECALDGSDTLKITHDRIAAHLGTAREVVTRMLRYFQAEGIVHLTRGAIKITDQTRLEELSA